MVMTVDELSQVSNFKVVRPAFGSIAWIDTIDLTGADLDRHVVIEKSSANVYHTLNGSSDYPSQGQKVEFSVHSDVRKNAAEGITACR